MTHTKTTILAALLSATALSGAYAADPIKIGVVTPLSGTYAGIGQQVKWGLELATKEVNAAGGIMGRQVELSFEDEEANPSVAVQKAEKLFQVGKVDFLTGTVNSGSTLAVGQVAERASKLIATTVSFADSITGDKCSPNVFRVNARAGQQSTALAAWLAKAKPKAKVFYLGPDYRNGPLNRGGIPGSSGEESAPPIVGEVFAPLDSKDYSQYFGQIRAAQPQVLYTSVAGNDTVRLFTQMQEFGLLEEPDRPRRIRHGDVAEHRCDRQGRRRLRRPASAIPPRSIPRTTRRSSTRSKRPTRPSPTSTAPTPMV